MGRIVLKRITMTLDEDSIQAAIDQVKLVKSGLANALSKLAKTLTETGIDVAKMNIASMGAVSSSGLFNSIDGYYNPKTHRGVIYSSAPYAILVEYGTGIVGENSPHPGITDSDWMDPESTSIGGHTYSDYDQNEHGDAGWWYPSPEGWYTPKTGLTNEEGWPLAWTRGMPSRPFMYDTFRELEALAEESGMTIIAEFFPEKE